jgi:hypothetical protein
LSRLEGVEHVNRRCRGGGTVTGDADEAAVRDCIIEMGYDLAPATG